MNPNFFKIRRAVLGFAATCCIVTSYGENSELHDPEEETILSVKEFAEEDGNAVDGTNFKPPAETQSKSDASLVVADESENDTPGVYIDRIVFGQSCALTGLTKESGESMRLGLSAAFDEVNRQGGIHGREIELITVDDGYEPEHAIRNTQQFIHEDEVFALIGAVGTPTSRAAVPIAAANGVPYIGPFTGASFLRQDNPHVVNLRASYVQETEAIVEFVTQEIGTERIAILYQDDSYGRAGYNGTKAAMERRGLNLIAAGVYRRNSIDVKTALLDIREASPDAILIVGSYHAAAEFILWGRLIGLDVAYINISFVNSNALARSLGSGGRGVLVSQVVPLPTADDPPILRTYRQALSTYQGGTVPGFTSLEGYLVGRLTIVALEEMGRDVTRPKFLRAVNSMKHADIGGFKLDFSDDNQGSDEVFLTVLRADGSYRSVESLEEWLR